MHRQDIPVDPRVAVNLLVAEDDDATEQIVRLVHAIRIAGFEPQVVLVGSVAWVQALREAGPGLVVLCRTEAFTPELLREVEAVFSGRGSIDQTLCTVELDARHKRALAAIEARLEALTSGRS